jgi:hypothetical protein
LVTYCHDKDITEEVFFKFRETIKGLEAYLKERTKQDISLHKTAKSTAEIFGILKRKDRGSLAELMKYIKGLKNTDLTLNGMDQIFP